MLFLVRIFSVICLLFCAALFQSLALPQQESTFEGAPAITLSNNKLELKIMTQGSSIASLVLADDPEKLNPLWNPMRMARELGHPTPYNGGTGHFICVDGFGAGSAEEQAAGFPFHGEAHLQKFNAQYNRLNVSFSLTMSAILPIVQEAFNRTYSMMGGENVIYVDSQLESLLGFDRPINWAEHASIGAPFLESGVTVVDLSSQRSRTRPYPTPTSGTLDRRLASGQDFTWPLAPGLDGKSVDLRLTPQNPHYLDHAATLVDPSQRLAWITALNPAKHLLLGYIFRREDYPWIQYWGNYPSNGKFARGLEFSTQPFDVSRREVVTMNTLFDTPIYRWLPAKSKIETHFLIFFTRVPEGFRKIDDVKLENRQITVEDRTAQKRVTLAASREL